MVGGFLQRLRPNRRWMLKYATTAPKKASMTSGVCNVYRPHVMNFTYTSAIFTDLVKKSTIWRYGLRKQAFDKQEQGGER